MAGVWRAAAMAHAATAVDALVEEVTTMVVTRTEPALAVHKT